MWTSSWIRPRYRALSGRVDSSADTDQLENRLAPLSHGDEALVVLQEFLTGLGSWRERQRFLNTHLLCAPTRYEDVRPRLRVDPGPFFVLQGDIIRTDEAFSLGERPRGASCAIATSTRDLMPSYSLSCQLPGAAKATRNCGGSWETWSASGRSATSICRPCRMTARMSCSTLSSSIRSRKRDVAVCERRASTTLVGWQVFGALLRSLEVREGAGEVDVRRLATEA